MPAYKIAFRFSLVTFRHLLKFGEVSHYLGYNALNDFFPRMPLRANPDCDTSICKERQKEFREAEEKRKREQVCIDTKCRSEKTKSIFIFGASNVISTA